MNPILGVLASLAQSAAAATAPVALPPVEALAPGVHLLRGAMLPERGPDGNTVLFETADGIVVVDTGRHAWHSDAILAFAATRGKAITAIVNTHWHLDHSSGNGRIRAVHPAAPIYATRAIDRALAAGGFLERNLRSARPLLDDPQLSETRREEVRIFVDTMSAADALRPDIAVETDGEREFAGRRLEFRVTDRAVTDADLWLYDAASGIAVIGDLVTLPAPFFETACPAEWRKALDQVWATPFLRAVPGHGEPLSRAQFDDYRRAFGEFTGCVEGTAPPAACADAWVGAIAPLLGAEQRAQDQAREYAQYYVGMLRQNHGRSADCLDR